MRIGLNKIQTSASLAVEGDGTNHAVGKRTFWKLGCRCGSFYRCQQKLFPAGRVFEIFLKWSLGSTSCVTEKCIRLVGE